MFDDSKKMTNLRLVIIFLDEAAQIIYLFPADSLYNRLYNQVGYLLQPSVSHDSNYV